MYKRSTKKYFYFFQSLTEQNIFLILLFFGIYFFAFYTDINPDYSSYKLIYSGSIPLNEPLYLLINKISRECGLSYDNFRSIIFVFSISSLFWVLKICQNENANQKNQKLHALNYALILFVLYIFILEFFVVRIRAGLAIAIISVGLALSKQIVSYRIRWPILFSSFVITFFIHKSTTVILAIIFFSMYLPSLKLYKKFNFNGVHEYLAFCLSISVTMLMALTYMNIERTLISPLNPIRLIAIAIIPLMIYLASIFLKHKNKLNLVDLNSISQRFEFFYAVMSFCLIIFYLCGFASTSGESLVRFFTLFSFPALLIFVWSGGVAFSLLTTYLLVVNSCFFLATLKMLPSSILHILDWLGKS